MAWLSVLPTGHVVSVRNYYDMRTDPDDETAVQVQLHTVVITEYRGLTYACATANDTPATYANGYKAYEVVAIEGGGYNLIETLDYTTGDWASTKYTVA